MPLQYFDAIQKLIAQVATEEEENLRTVAKLLCQSVLNKKAIYVYGASHAAIITMEMFYRAGGLMTINPIFGSETSLETRPVSHTSNIERLNGYGAILAKKVKFKQDDVVLLHSVSGRNPAAIEVAIAANEAGACTVAITSLEYSKSVTSRHSSGQRLYQVCSYVLNNHADVGDAICQINGLQQKVGPSSTVIGAALVNALVVETVQLLVENGLKHPPVFYSANLDGGDQLNQKLAAEYADAIKYDL